MGCGVLSAPTADVDGVSVTSLGLTEAEVQIGVGVHNPLWVDVPVDALRWEMRVADVTLGDGVSSQQHVLPSQQRTVLPVPVQIRYADLWAAAKETMSNEGVPYTVLFELDTQTPRGPETLEMRHDGQLPVLRAPSLDLVDIDVGIEDDGRLRVELGLHLGLPQDYSIVDLQWGVSVDGVSLTDGRVQADGSGTLRLPVFFDARATAEATWAYAWGEAKAMQVMLSGNVSTPFGTVPLSLDRQVALSEAPAAPETP